ncbi:PKD repeat protein [Flavobacteriaceae bacterium MAR_2009_75]|nr:PKD repeat protein [Flavobacteriaceae bacterium MAR_2009_75]
MKLNPTTNAKNFLCSYFLFIFLCLSCNKDEDSFYDAIKNSPVLISEESIIENDDSEEASEDEKFDSDEVVVNDEEAKEENIVIESRTAAFSPLEDAYIENGSGFNHELIRLQENKRTSYLLYDLSAVDSIKGKIVEAHFQFTVQKDSGDGLIEVHTGDSDSWTEEDINADIAPEPLNIVGTVDKDYKVGQTEIVVLNSKEISPESTTLILVHTQGDDLAIASKEHPTVEPPLLIITYEAPVDAGRIDQYVLNPSSITEHTPIDTEENLEIEEEVKEETVSEDEEIKEETVSEDEEIKEETVSEDEEIKEETVSEDEEIKEETVSEDEEIKEETVSEDEEIKEETVSEGEEVKEETTAEPVNEKPVARIEANKTKGEAPLEIKFDSNNSSDDKSIVRHTWDFDDDSNSSSKNTSHTFDKAGVYKVTLTVQDEEGLKDTTSVTITVEEPKNEAPIAKASADVTSGELPLEISFRASNSTDDKSIKSYKWNFKDGSSSSSKNPKHIFKKPGTFEVELTVKDEEGLEDNTTMTIVVSEPANQSPIAVAKANVSKGEVPLEVKFSGRNSSDDKAIVSYSWDFGVYGTSNQENPELTFEEPGTYKVNLTVRDEEGLKHTNSITITAEPKPIPETPSTSADVRYWQNLFDSKWSSERSKAYSMANSRGKNQEYYYLGLYIDGLSSIWQATGDNSYLDTALDIVGITVDKATSVGGGYLGWPAHDGDEYALWDTHYWRVVATLLRIMHQSSNIKSSSKYKNQLNDLLAFSEKHIWERYDSQHSSKIYRSNTHMSSHWARIGMELYLITKKNKYKQVFENMSFGTMPGEPSNFRNQIYPNPKNSSAYAWDKTWGRHGSDIQDTSHGGAIVSFWLLAFENGMYWNKSDMNALIKTVDIIWSDSNTDHIKRNIDGTGGNGSQGKIHEWLNLARYSQKLQNKIKAHYDKSHLNFFGPQAIGIAALNAKILADGRPVYP